jgi:hypothetical protein
MVETISKVNRFYFNQDKKDEEGQKRNIKIRSRIVSALKFITAPILIQQEVNDMDDDADRLMVTSLWRYFDNICKYTMFEKWLDPNSANFYSDIQKFDGKDLLYGILPSLYIDPVSYQMADDQLVNFSMGEARVY